MSAKSLQLCPTLCNPMDCSPAGSSVRGSLQATILEWVAIPSSGELPDPGMESVSLMSPILAGGFFATSTTCADHILLTPCCKGILPFYCNVKANIIGFTF